MVIEFPPALYAATQRAVEALAIDQRTLIRSAVEDFLRKLPGKKIEKALVEGYIANAQQARDLNEEFVPVDCELL